MSSPTLDGLVAAVREFAAAPAGELTDSEVVDELATLRRLADIAEAAYLSRLAVFDSRRLSETDGLATRPWIRHQLHVAPGETTRSLKIAKGLADLPTVAAALVDGEIRVPHAAAIVDGASLLGTDVIAAAQDALVEAARLDDPTRLRAALRGYGAAVDNTRAVRAAERRDEGRWLHIATTFDGAVSIQGVFGAEDGAAVKAAVESLSAPVRDDSRTAGQRRADALAEICRRQLASGTLPSRSGEPAQITVVTDLATIERRTGGFGQLPDGEVLHGEAVRRLACDAKITRLIVGPESMPLDVGRAQRTATRAQRQALRVRDDGCRFPGCDRPADWCDVHHVTFWSHGGRTDVDEMISLCRKHHTAVHEGGWQVRTIGPGRFVFTNPTGQPVPDGAGQPTIRLVTELVNTTTRPPPRAGPNPHDPRQSHIRQDDVIQADVRQSDVRQSDLDQGDARREDMDQREVA